MARAGNLQEFLFPPAQNAFFDSKVLLFMVRRSRHTLFARTLLLAKVRKLADLPMIHPPLLQNSSLPPAY